MFDGKAFGQEIVAAVKEHIDKTVAPLHSHIADLEKRLAEMPAPKDGKDADVDEVAALAAASILPDIMAVRSMVEGLPKLPDISELVAEAVKGIPAPKDGADGKSITAEDLAPLIADEVTKAVTALPPAKDGQPGKDADPELIKAMVDEAVAALPPAEKGKDADPVEMERMVAEHVERAVAALPAPKDGKDGAPGADGKDGAPGKDGEPGLNGKDGRDGLDVVKFIRDDRGHLNGVLRDGTTVDLGEYVGKDGAVGERGKDGLDGVGFDDMSCEVRDDGVYLVWEKGDLVKEARLPVPIYRGVFKDGQVYRKGDTTTWGGSLWHCDADQTDDKPDGGTKSWTLAAKRGRDGKDAPPPPSTKPDPKKGK